MRVLEYSLLGALLVCSSQCFSPSYQFLSVRKPISLRCSRSPAFSTSVCRRSLLAMSSTTTGDLETIKSDLLTQLSVGSGLKQAADQNNRIKVNEALLRLEPHNPTGLLGSSTEPLKFLLIFFQRILRTLPF